MSEESELVDAVIKAATEVEGRKKLGCGEAFSACRAIRRESAGNRTNLQRSEYQDTQLPAWVLQMRNHN